MLPELFVAVSRNLGKHEGRVLAIYPDSKGIPTCGVGRALFAPVDAYRVAFWKEINVLANRADILAAWTAVKYAKVKRALMMSYEESDRLLSEDLKRFECVVMRTFPESQSYPLSVQVAIYDICFNCGSFTGWPRFSAHILARNWVGAASESHRPDVGDERNADTKEQLLNPRDVL